MNFSIDLDELECDGESVTNIIMFEVKEEIRRAVKRELKGKSSELNKAIQSYANTQAAIIKKEMEEKLMGLN